MNLSITSIVTACLLNSLLIICVCILAKKDSVISRMGPECMIFIMLVMILRMFFPFEFPYTYSIWIEDSLNFIMTFFLYPIFSGNIQIMVWHVLMAVWEIGAIWGLIHSILTYRNILRYTELLPEEKWETKAAYCADSAGCGDWDYLHRCDDRTRKWSQGVHAG